MPIFALVDCNNFYVSCERVFNPGLENKPVIVLSNNDGCVIARSNEAKKAGVKMGVPAFDIKDIIYKHNIHVFSSNFSLYGDISNRITGMLYRFSPKIEIYSIDEAFIELDETYTSSLPYEIALEIKESIMKGIGIPVSIGIGQTKTLAKIASHLAKKNIEGTGIFNFLNYNNIDEILSKIPIEEVWGIGDSYKNLLMENNIKTALNLKNADEKCIKKHLTVMGARTITELKGISYFSIEKNNPDKKGILTSRSFGKPLTELEDIEQAISTFAARSGEKLRKQKCCASMLTVFIMTNIYDKGPRYLNSKTIQLPEATSNSNIIIKYAVNAIRSVFKKGYKYKKTGIYLTQIIPENAVQLSIWNEAQNDKFRDVMKVIDKINSSIGHESIKFGTQGTERKWKMRQEKLSPCYTTKWDDILKIKI